MNANRIAAILAGVLYFLGLIAGMLSVVPVIDLPDYLVQISAHVGQVTSGAFFQFLMMAAYVGMAITLYPILQKHNESLALGYVGFRPAHLRLHEFSTSPARGGLCRLAACQRGQSICSHLQDC